MGNETEANETLELLEERGLVIYRAHADEYRLWAGSDIDLAARIRTARDAITEDDAADLLAQTYAPAAIVAGRHSQETGVFRHFLAAVAHGTSRIIAGPNTDGYVLFRLDRSDQPAQIDTELPVLVGQSDSAASVTAAALDLLALRAVYQQADLDSAARREVRERLAVTHADLGATLLQAFGPSSPGCRWTLQVGAEHTAMPTSQSLSALVSAACDLAYAKTPKISNEMIGRHQLTSQGAKARRELASALIENPELECGGLEGYGPEIAMYQGVFEALGLHGRDKSGVYRWQAPGAGSTARPVFDALRNMIRKAPSSIGLDEIQARVALPPWGVQAGLFPLLALSLISADSDDLIVMEDGSFQPRITPEHFERLVKSPARFRVKYAGSATGLRGTYLAALSEAIRLRPARRSRGRNTSLVGLTATLLAPIGDATPFALSTGILAPSARAVRAALREARDPETLLFETLPHAVGADAIPVDAPASIDDAERVAGAIADALRGIEELSEVLQDRIGDAVVAATGCRTLDDARATLLAQANDITDLPTDAKLRGIIGVARDCETDADDWSRQLALLVTDQPPTSWRDEVLNAYPRLLGQALGTIRRLRALQFEPGSQAGDAVLGRITVTSRDGREDHRILDLPSADRQTVDRLIGDLLANALGELGERAPELLLAGLVERVAAAELLDRENEGAKV